MEQVKGVEKKSNILSTESIPKNTLEIFAYIEPIYTVVFSCEDGVGKCMLPKNVRRTKQR